MIMKNLRRRLSVVFGISVIASIGIITPLTANVSASVRPATTSGHLPKAACAKNQALGQVTFVSPFGFGPGPGLLEIFVAKQLGYFSDECLNVNIVTSSYVPNELVSAGTAQFTSEGSAADTLEAIASGSNLVGLATFADASTYVLLTQPSITNLKQLDGMSVAYHTQMPVVLEEMLKKAGVNYSSLDLLNDNSYDPTLLTQGKFDALQAYTVNEPLTLRAAGLKFNEFFPAKYGVSGTFNTVVGNATWVKAHPAATADFLRAEMHAIDYCEGHALTCIKMQAVDAGAAGAVYDIQHSIQEWNLSISIVKHNTLPGAGIGVQTIAEWEPEAKAIKAYDILPSVPSLKAVVNTSLIDSIYNGKTLIWPGT
jgi:ABC-type nitrate/sulfonate/bicarbonate transport system substrate-binding protein